VTLDLLAQQAHKDLKVNKVSKEILETLDLLVLQDLLVLMEFIKYLLQHRHLL
jgi:hypothetical protein